MRGLLISKYQDIKISRKRFQEKAIQDHEIPKQGSFGFEWCLLSRPCGRFLTVRFGRGAVLILVDVVFEKRDATSDRSQIFPEELPKSADSWAASQEISPGHEKSQSCR